MSSPGGNDGVAGGAFRAALRYAVPAAVVVLCVVFAAALGSGPDGTGVSLPTVRPGEPTGGGSQGAAREAPPSATPSAEPAPPEAPAALRYIVAGIVLISVGVLVWLVIRLLLRLRLRARRVRVRTEVAETGQESFDPDPDATGEEQVRSAVAAGLRDLEDDSDPRRAVIVCWLRLEEAAASAGTPRRDEDTPADLVTRLLAGQLEGRESSVDALYRFADIYRRARYAPDEVAVQMRDEASEALSALSAELERVADR